MSPRKPHVFISHSRGDKESFVRNLAEDLRQTGAQVFYDEWSMKPGDRLRDKISSGIEGCDYFIIVLSVRSVRSSWVRRELDEAMILEVQGRGPKIVPVLIGRVKETDIPIDLHGLVWVDFRTRGREQYYRGVSRLLDTLGLDTLGLDKNIKARFIKAGKNQIATETYTRITLFLPVPTTFSQFIMVDQMLSDLTMICGGAVVSSHSPPVFSNHWININDGRDMMVVEDSWLIMADVPLEPQHPDLITYLTHLMERCEKEFHQSIWVTTQNVHRVSAGTPML